MKVEVKLILEKMMVGVEFDGLVVEEVEFFVDLFFVYVF